MRELVLAGLRTQIRSAAVPPTPPSGALVLLHGYGVAGDHLVYLSEQLDLPSGTVLVFPEAPLELEPGFGEARAWWQINENALRKSMVTGQTALVSEAAEGDRPSARRAIGNWMNALLLELGLAPEQIVLGGFSQGANAALDFVLNDNRPWAGLVFLSGTRINGAGFAEPLQSRAPMRAYVSHGRLDPILPLCVTKQLCSELQNAQWNVELSVFDGDHGIPPQVIYDVSRTAKRFLGSLGPE